MEKIARGCFISPQPCLCTSAAHIFSSLTFNQSSLLCISLPPSPSSPSFIPSTSSCFLRSLCEFLGAFIPRSASCSGWSLPFLPCPHPSVNPGGPERTRHHSHFGPALREDEAGKVTEEEREGAEERGTEEVTGPF